MLDPFFLGIILRLLIIEVPVKTITLWLVSKKIVRLEKVTFYRVFGTTVLLIGFTFIQNLVSVNEIIGVILQIAVEIILVKEILEANWGEALRTTWMHTIISSIVSILTEYLLLFSLAFLVGTFG